MAEQEKPAQHQEQNEEEEESTPKSPPLKLPRLESDAGLVTTAVASPLVLGLGLGLGLGGDEAAAAKHKGFTFMQMQEYHHQKLIFDHMVAGIPVPVHLILPIWKSVASSYGPHHYPSFVGLGNLCYDFRNSMEPEPGRCRRTDGKKWRCSRDVVQDQKYCERHMHRGRNRSRKPVEGAIAVAAPAAAAAADSIANDNEPTNKSSNSNVGTAPPMIGSSHISVLSSSTAACKTGAS